MQQFTYTIEKIESPLNCFRNQIILEEARYSLKRYFIFIGTKSRHIIHFTEKSTLLETLKPIINPTVVNAIHCILPTLASIQHALVSNFPATKFWHCKNFVSDISDKSEQIKKNYRRAQSCTQSCSEKYETSPPRLLFSENVQVSDRGSDKLQNVHYRYV